MKFLHVLIVLFTTAFLVAQHKENDITHVSKGNLWIRLKVPAERPLVLLALEEVEEFKEKYGDWLPKEFLKINGPHVDIRLNSIQRINNRIAIDIEIRNQSGDIKQLNFNFFNKGPDQLIESILSYDGDCYIDLSWEENNELNSVAKNKNRKIFIGFGSNVDYFKSKIKVSKSAILFNWNDFQATSF